MIETFLEYRTLDGDRWDSIAWKLYGDAWAYEAIVAANPSVPIMPVLPGGILLRIPLRAARELEAAQLPPWKRP